MEFTVPSKPFKESFAAVARFVPARSPKPVLQSVLLTVADGQATLEATDGDVSIRRRLPVEASRPGRCLLPREQTTRLLATADGETLRLRLSVDQLSIRGGQARWTMLTGDCDLFPAVTTEPPTACHVLSAEDFKRLIRRTVHAIDEKSSSYALGGLLIEATPTTFAAIGTNGRVLCRCEVPASFAGEWSDPAERERILPGRTAKELLAIVPDEGEVAIGFPDQNTVRVEFGPTVVVSKLVEGRYPAYHRILPESYRYTAETLARPFLAAVEQASAFRTDASRAVDFDFAAKGLAMTATAADAGKAEVDYEVLWPFGPIGFRLDTQYLVGLLKALGDDASITVAVNGLADPFRVTTADGFLGAVSTMAKEEPK